MKRGAPLGGGIKKVRLSKIQKGIAKALSEDPSMSLKDAAKAAGSKGSTDASLASIAGHAIAKPGFQEHFRQLMDARPKLKDEALLKKLEEGLDADEIQFFADKGKVKDSRTKTAYSTRYSYLDLSMRLKGLGQKLEVTGAGGAPLIPPSSPVLAAMGEEALILLAKAAEEALKGTANAGGEVQQ